MKTIYKYPLNVTDYQEIEMPEDSTILCVDTQHETPCIWAIVDTEKGMTKRKIYVYGTGHPMNSDIFAYIGTFMINGGAFVFHVFEG